MASFCSRAAGIQASLRQIPELQSSTKRKYIAPLSVIWRNEEFLSFTDSDNTTLSWVQTTFSGLWGLVLQSLSHVHGVLKNPDVTQEAQNACIQWFAWVITTGGKFNQTSDEAIIQDIEKNCLSFETEWC